MEGYLNMWCQDGLLVGFVVGTIEDCVGGVQSEGLDGKGRYECRLSVKISAICQLAVHPIQTLQNIFGVFKKKTETAFECLCLGKGGGGGGRENWKLQFCFRHPLPPLFVYLRRR